MMVALQIALIGDLTTPTEALDGQLGGLGVGGRVQGAWVGLEGLQGAQGHLEQRLLLVEAKQVEDERFNDALVFNGHLFLSSTPERICDLKVKEQSDEPSLCKVICLDTHAFHGDAEFWQVVPDVDAQLAAGFDHGFGGLVEKDSGQPTAHEEPVDQLVGHLG